jgi:hypothetical protein
MASVTEGMRTLGRGGDACGDLKEEVVVVCGIMSLDGTLAARAGQVLGGWQLWISDFKPSPQRQLPAHWIDGATPNRQSRPVPRAFSQGSATVAFPAVLLSLRRCSFGARAVSVQTARSRGSLSRHAIDDPCLTTDSDSDSAHRLLSHGGHGAATSRAGHHCRPSSTPTAKSCAAAAAGRNCTRRGTLATPLERLKIVLPVKATRFAVIDESAWKASVLGACPALLHPPLLSTHQALYRPSAAPKLPPGGSVLQGIDGSLATPTALAAAYQTLGMHMLKSRSFPSFVLWNISASTVWPSSSADYCNSTMVYHELWISLRPSSRR